jgi:hypothetical protein
MILLFGGCTLFAISRFSSADEIQKTSPHESEKKQVETPAMELGKMNMGSPTSFIEKQLGPPIEVAKLGNKDEVDASYYQLAKNIYVVDYFVGKNRIGTAAYSKDKDIRIPRDIKLSDVTLGEASEQCAGIFGSSHLFTYTGPCGGSSADANFYHSYIFYTFGDDTKIDQDELCNPLTFETTPFSVKRCPLAALTKAVGGVWSDTPEGLEKARNLFIDELDVGRRFTWGT